MQVVKEINLEISHRQSVSVDNIHRHMARKKVLTFSSHPPFGALLKDIEATWEAYYAYNEDNEEVLHVIDDFNDHPDESGCGLEYSEEIEHLNPQDNQTDWSQRSINLIWNRGYIEDNNYCTKSVAYQICEIPERREIVFGIASELKELHVKKVNQL